MRVVRKTLEVRLNYYCYSGESDDDDILPEAEKMAQKGLEDRITQAPKRNFSKVSVAFDGFLCGISGGSRISDQWRDIVCDVMCTCILRMNSTDEYNVNIQMLHFTRCMCVQRTTKRKRKHSSS